MSTPARWRRLLPTSPISRRWLVGALALGVSVTAALGVGQVAADQLHVARYGELLGTSRPGEWADLSAYGLRIRLDEFAIADRFESRYSPDEPAEPLPGMQLVRVRMTVEPGVDIARDNYKDMISCDIALWTKSGARITASGPMVAGPEASSCTGIERPIVKGAPVEIQEIFQVLPADTDGLVVQVTTADVRPEAGGTWPVWDFRTG